MEGLPRSSRQGGAAGGKCPAEPVPNYTIMESLILAQDECWRRA